MYLAGFAIGDHTPVAPRIMLAIAAFGDDTSAQMTYTFRFDLGASTRNMRHGQCANLQRLC